VLSLAICHLAFNSKKTFTPLNCILISRLTKTVSDIIIIIIDNCGSKYVQKSLIFKILETTYGDALEYNSKYRYKKLL